MLIGGRILIYGSSTAETTEPSYQLYHNNYVEKIFYVLSHSSSSVGFNLFAYLPVVFPLIAILMSILYLILRMLRPIFSLTKATAEVEKGNSVNRKGNDELATLSESFNSMVYSIKEHIENQNVLTSKFENAYEELTS